MTAGAGAAPAGAAGAGARGRPGRELSIALQSDEDLATYATLAPRIEELGFGAISVYSDLLYPSPLLPLITIAQATRRIRLGPACLNPYLLHPLEIANQLSLLDAASGGRAYLGLARGAWLDAVGVTQDRPVRRLREAIEVVRYLFSGAFSGPAEGYSGEIFRVQPGVRLAYRPVREDVEVLVGAWGPLGLALAGELASEVKIGGSANPALLASARRALARGEARARRPAGTVGLACGAVTVVDEDGASARRLARAEVATYLPVVAGLDRVALDPDSDPGVDPGLDPDSDPGVDPGLTPHSDADLAPDPDLGQADLAAMQRLVRAGDHEGAGRLVPDAVLDRFAFSGTPGQVAAQVEALFAAGATRVEFGTPHGLTTARGIELIGRHVLPAVRMR
jgi:5,10-methylenetetrahydromethanopterin reductase